MTYKLVYSDSYIRRVKTFLRKHPEIHNKYWKTLELLEINPHNPSFRLMCRLIGLSSVSINMSYCIVLELVIQDKDIILVDIGTHDQVYYL